MMLVVTVALVVIVIIMESRDTDGDDDGVGGNVGGMISWLVYVLPIFYLCSHFPNASLLTAYLPDLRCLSYRYILRQRCALHTFVELKIMR